MVVRVRVTVGVMQWGLCHGAWYMPIMHAPLPCVPYGLSGYATEPGVRDVDRVWAASIVMI